MGRWYEVERSFYIMELTSTCMDIDLSMNARGQIEVEVNTKSIWLVFKFMCLCQSPIMVI